MMKGSYILVIFVKMPSTAKIGALGKVKFDKGYYFYVGSAMGEKGSTSLINRVKRHISDSIHKKIHWHIDYLLDNENSSIKRILLIPSRTSYECILAGNLMDTADSYIKGFGSSDCVCLSHLFYFQELQNTYF